MSDLKFDPNSVEPVQWPDPLPIPSDLLPVAPFDSDLLPDAMRPWAEDIAERMQCPLDFVAVAIMASLSSVIGRKACIQPKREDDWKVTPNLWACVVGRPGVMKSPALSESMKPLERLIMSAEESYLEAKKDYEIESQLSEMAEAEAEKKARQLVKNGDIEAAKLVLHDLRESIQDSVPLRKRYKVNDATVEALGEILIENPNGVLAYRDELNGLLRSLDKEGQEGARAFYLQGYDGDQGYTFDRIMRGRNLHIPSVCISMLGGIQPSKLQSYLNDAVKGGAGDDGLLQRFGLLVWPDISSKWENIDRKPDARARDTAFEVFQKLDALEADVDVETGEATPYIYRFDNDAQLLFEQWRQGYEEDIRSEDKYHPALVSHLAKYRKLVPALALVSSLADGEAEVSVASTLKALAWEQYLRTHAERAYAAGIKPTTEPARALLSKIRAGAVPDGFTARDVYLKGWSRLSTPDAVHEAAAMLVDLNYLIEDIKPPTAIGGRPSVSYNINPKAKRGK